MNRERLETLILRWSGGALDEAETRELEALLRISVEARQLFRRHANLDVALREWAEQRMADSPWQPAARGERPRRKSARWLYFAAAAAAVCLLAGYLFSSSAPQQHPEPSSPVANAGENTAHGCAVLAQTFDAQYPAAAAPHLGGDTLAPGRFDLARGFAQIEFFSGATLIVEGAAQLELVSAWEARCLSGKVRVRVPPAAHGFRLHAPGMQLVDLGTEFAVNVAGSDAKVHVFNGEVRAHPAGGGELSLREGQSLAGPQFAALDPGQFLGIGQLQELVAGHREKRREAWTQWSLAARRDDRLIAYYPFLHFSQWERLVNNVAEPHTPERNGGAVGATWTQGRWPGKDALEFKRPGDRVRLNLDGTWSALTLACWVKVDAVDKKYNSLLLTDGYDNGEPHWQIYEDGSLMFSIMYRPDAKASSSDWNQMYYSRPVFTADSLGRWHYLAVSYDNQSGVVTQYFDGREVGREISRLHQPGRPIVFGPCELGNWGLPTEGHRFPIRNLNGAIDEFAIYRAALGAEEIRALYEAGRPE